MKKIQKTMKYIGNWEYLRKIATFNDLKTYIFVIDQDSDVRLHNKLSFSGKRVLSNSSTILMKTKNKLTYRWPDVDVHDYKWIYFEIPKNKERMKFLSCKVENVKIFIDYHLTK